MDRAAEVAMTGLAEASEIVMVRLSRKIGASLLALAALAASSVAAQAQQPRPQRPTGSAAAPAASLPTRTAIEHTTQLATEGASQQLCESVAGRVFVRHDLGTACIAYYATSGQAQFRPAVVYFEGDVPAGELLKPNFTRDYLANMRSVFQNLASRSSVRFVFIARPGLFGSSGNHAARRSAAEMLSMNAALDAVKARLRLTDIVLAGQSGGSTVAAALLTLGRRDVTCAILGSGLLSVVEIEHAHRVREHLPTIRPALLQVLLFDPTDRLDWIERLAERRIFVLGDPTDTRTPFPQQRRFAEQVRALGHHATAIEVTGQGELMHGVAHHTLPAAAQCARGADDAAIRQTVAPRRRPVAPTVTARVDR